jgi:hypothetical protein
MFGSYKSQTFTKIIRWASSTQEATPMQLPTIATKTTQIHIFATTITNYIATCYTQNHVQNTQTKLC